MTTRIIYENKIPIMQVLINLEYYPYYDWVDYDFALGTA